MIHKIQVIPKTTASQILLFNEIDLDQLPDIRIVPLFGANGSGKTTLLEQINNSSYAMSYDQQEHDNTLGEALRGVRHPKRKQIMLTCDDERTELYGYTNSKDNFANREIGFDPFMINARWEAKALSEGQSIIYSAMDLLKGMLKSTKKNESFVKDDNHAIVLLDELDSGMSMDNIRKCMEIIKKVLRQKRNIQFFLSFNNPYVCYFFPQVISMYDGKVHEIRNLDEMLAELDANGDQLKAARCKRNGKYKIFD